MKAGTLMMNIMLPESFVRKQKILETLRFFLNLMRFFMAWPNVDQDCSLSRA
jgi:hypothetical protein